MVATAVRALFLGIVITAGRCGKTRFQSKGGIYFLPLLWGSENITNLVFEKRERMKRVQYSTIRQREHDEISLPSPPFHHTTAATPSLPQRTFSRRYFHCDEFFGRGLIDVRDARVTGAAGRQDGGGGGGGYGQGQKKNIVGLVWELWGSMEIKNLFNQELRKELKISINNLINHYCLHTDIFQ